MTGLEKGFLGALRLQAAIVGVPILIGALIGEAAGISKSPLPHGVVMVPALLLVGYLLLLSAPKHFKAWGYDCGTDDLQIRHGVWTKVETVLPLGRVQHIDIAQGPVERVFSVVRLALYTAGTAHSCVTVPGLSRETAEALRDQIRARIGQELP